MISQAGIWYRHVVLSSLSSHSTSGILVPSVGAITHTHSLGANNGTYIKEKTEQFTTNMVEGGPTEKHGTNSV